MIKIKTPFVAKNLLVILFFLLSLQSNVSAKDKAEEMDALMNLYHDYGQFSGSVLVSEGGKVLFKQSYGFANREWNVANTTDTKFRIASLTKQFTAMLIMQLVEKGKIKLDANITDYLSYYRQDTGEKVTIHHLLTHTSGVPSYTSRKNFSDRTNRMPVEDFVKQYCSDDLEFESGTKYVYSNSGYFLLGAIVENVSGKTYEAMLQENIFTPLGMNNSGYDHHHKIIKKRASGYDKYIGEFSNASFIDMSLPYAAGAIYSTVEDLHLWDQALYTENLLSNKYKDLMFAPFLDEYAYGWGVNNFEFKDSDKKVKQMTHAGGINGFSTYIVRYVDQKNSVILLSNAPGGSIGGMSRQLTNILYSKPFDKPKRSIYETLFKVISDNDVETTIDKYHQLKKHNLDEYNFEERELNRLGYTLLARDKKTEAIAILKLNAELFPESTNVYDSLAEVYLENGQKKLAIANYEKILTMEPENSRAIKALEKIKKMGLKHYRD